MHTYFCKYRYIYLDLFFLNLYIFLFLFLPASKFKINQLGRVTVKAIAFCILTLKKGVERIYNILYIYIYIYICKDIRFLLDTIKRLDFLYLQQSPLQIAR